MLIVNLPEKPTSMDGKRKAMGLEDRKQDSRVAWYGAVRFSLSKDFDFQY